VMRVQRRSVRKDPLQRSFLTLPHLEEGRLDHRGGDGPR